MAALLLCLFQLVSIAVCGQPEVVLSTGRVRGQQLVSVANRSYYSFKGIPYAAPPVGHLRFKAPQPPVSWDGTLEAFDIPPACTQPRRVLKYPERYSEDCLYINVFTPYLNPPKGKLMAVMFWIHGGKHYEGSSTVLKYGPDFLITEDVVLVTFNYRLGVFGYLNSHSESAQGNASLKDMVAALRWVQREISKFGGDPDSVTIFGGSSGANDVNCLYLSPLAKGLFHRAIAQSGARCELVTLHNTDLTSKLAKVFGCTSSDAEGKVACLRNIKAQELAEKQKEIVIPLPGQNANPFTMTVEEDHGEEIFMPVSPTDLLRNSKSDLPYLMGMNSAEGLMFVDDPSENPSQFSDFARNFELYIPSEIRANKNYKELLNIMKKLKRYYFKNMEISLKSVYGFINFMTDSRYSFYIPRVATTLSKRVPVYLYYFAFEGEFKVPRSVITKLKLTGVNHGDENSYLFYRTAIVPKQKHLYKYPRECAAVTRMVRLWTNFAKYGNPTPNKSDEILNVTWLPVNGYLTQHLVINETLRMETKSLLEEREALWESFWSLSSERDEVFLAINIIVVILLLAILSLIYLIYTSSCSKGYMVL